MNTNRQFPFLISWHCSVCGPNSEHYPVCFFSAMAEKPQFGVWPHASVLNVESDKSKKYRLRVA